MSDAFWSSMGQSWPQLADLLLAFLLSSAIGLERQLRQKGAGLRTHTLVGLGSALFMLASKYGFADMLAYNHVALDPSRIAAQIVSGIGFIGGGVIFVRKDAVRGLTTASIVWVVAAVGTACGAGLPLLALAVVAIHFVTVFGYTRLSARLSKVRERNAQVRMSYYEGYGVLRAALSRCTENGFVVTDTQAEHTPSCQPPETSSGGAAVMTGRMVRMTLTIVGRGSVHGLVEHLLDIPGMVATDGRDPDSTDDEA